MLGNQLIDAARDAVVNQIQHPAIRVKVQPQLGFVRQFFMQILDGRWNVQQQQAARSLPHRLLLFLLAVEQTDRHAVFFIHQRRIRLHRIATAFLLIKLRQFAEAPDMQIALFQPIVRHRRQRFLHLVLQLELQCRQIFAFKQGFVFFTHHPECHLEVIGHLIPLPVFT
ncbi:hypothetical protein D3C78_983810 [compost metagenome]